MSHFGDERVLRDRLAIVQLGPGCGVILLFFRFFFFSVFSGTRRQCLRSLPTDAHCTLAAAFIASRLDYCNAVLYGTSAAVSRRLWC